jgi:hypothetical protein
MADVTYGTLIYDPSKGHDVSVGVTIPNSDLSKCKTQEEAAKKLYAAIRKHASDLGMDPDSEVHLYPPHETKERGYGEFWWLTWEAGPYNWAVATFVNGPWGHCEPYYGFDLQFVS